MRDYKTEETDSFSKGSNPIRHWFGWDYVSNSNGWKQHRSDARMHYVGRHPIGSWVDCNRTWFAWRVTATTIYCGLFGGYIGQLLHVIVGML